MLAARSAWTSPALALSLLTSLTACPSDPPGADEASDSGTDTSPAETETETETGDTGGIMPEVAWPLLDCDPLVPQYCGFPYPNNVFTRDDPGTETGRRLALSEALMPNGDGPEPALDDWLASDGFSPAGTLLAFVPGATTAGLATPLTIEASLDEGSPTVIIDAETGERIPHFAELDMSHGNDNRRAFMIQPVVRLEPATRYIVAIRGLVDDQGGTIAPSPGFAALRDELPDGDPAIEDRRGLYADIFARLADAGVAREELQLAWDFTTASDANITGRMVHIRDEGLALIGPEGPAYEIVEVVDNPAPGLAMRIEGLMTVPLYLDDPGPGGRMQFGDDGLPEPSGTADYPFMALIPTTALSEPAGLLQFGHGLFGSYEDVDDDMLINIAVERNMIVFATSWIGMANEDVLHIANLLQDGRIDDWATVVDRLGQGVFNALAAMHMMKTSFAADPLVQGMGDPAIDPSQAYYFGASQGGIIGSTYMALTTDVERGILAVPGQPYILLLHRSEAWQELDMLLSLALPDQLDHRFAMELMQVLWDRTEPSGYSRHIIDDPLPGSPTHEVLVLAAIGDHLVTTLGAHVMTRELGIPQIAPVNRSLFGIDEVEQPYEGSALVEYDFGLPAEPIENVPMTEGSDPHGAIADVPPAFEMIDQFLRTGVVETFCAGSCDPE